MIDEPDPVWYIRSEPIEEQLKYCAARWVYRRQNVLQPNKTPDGGREDWKTWWERLFKDHYPTYIESMKQKYSYIE